MSKQQYFFPLFNKIRDYLIFTKNIHANEVKKSNSKIWGTLNTYSAIKKTQAEIDEYLFEPGKKLLVDIGGDKIPQNYKGMFFARNGDSVKCAESKLYMPLEEEVYASNVLAIGGKDFTTGRHLSALLKTTTVLASMNSRGLEAYYKAIAVMPEVDEKERYQAAEKYSINSKYYPKYIEDRVEKFLIPKFIDVDMDGDSTIFNVPQSIALLAFSLGGRDVMMMENALYDILTNKYSLDSTLVNRLMKNVNAVCIGYAPKLDVFKENGFNKIILFSREDRAVLEPKDFYRDILTKKAIVEDNFFIRDFTYPNSKIWNYLIINNKETEKDNELEKDNLDHTLGTYLHWINLLPTEVKEVIGNSLVCNGFDKPIDEYYEN